MLEFNEVKERLYKEEFSPTDIESRRFVAFDPSLRYLRDMQGEVIRQADEDEDPIAFQMRYTFFPDLDLENARKNVIGAINYGAKKMNEFFYQSFGDISLPFGLHSVSEDTNLTHMLKNAQRDYLEAMSNGSHPMVRADGSLKPVVTIQGNTRRFYDYPLLAEAFKTVKSVGVGYNILKIIQSSEFVLHDLHHNNLVEWVESCIGTDYVLEFQSRKKSEMSILSKMACRGYNIGTVKDLTGTRFVLQDREKVGDLLRLAKSKVRGASGVEGFERTKDRKLKDSPYYDPRFDCDKFVLRPSILSVFEERVFSNSPDLEGIVGRSRIRLPVEIQVFTEEALSRMNEDPKEVPAHKLYKHRKALAFWQIVNPWEIFGPLMIQDNNFLQNRR